MVPNVDNTFVEVEFVETIFADTSELEVIFVVKRLGIVANVIRAFADVNPVDKFSVADELFVDNWLVFINVVIVAFVMDSLELLKLVTLKFVVEILGMLIELVDRLVITALVQVVLTKFARELVKTLVSIFEEVIFVVKRLASVEF
jgi:hypothetical protein